jgi:hypothetical protein
MRITQDIHEDADDSIEVGMKEKATEFVQTGSELYK